MASLPKVWAETWPEGTPPPFDGASLPGSEEPRLHGTMGLSRRVVLRVAPVALIVFIGAAFVVVTFTGTGGTAFEGLVLASSLLLVLIVGYIAFAGEQARAGQTYLDEFERAEPGDPVGNAPSRPDFEAPRRISLPSSSGRNPATSPVRAFVETLVAVPAPPPPPVTPASRQAYVAALRLEGKQLIGLARVTGVDTEPYRLHLLDARKAAYQGDLEVSLTSLRLANELLRRTVESAFLKHQMRGDDPRSRGRL